MEELLAEVRAARRAEAALDRHARRVKALLIDVRLEALREGKSLKIADLEASIGKFYDRATISRYTADAVKAAKAELDSSPRS
jgi:hypothetical protein